MNPLEAMVGQGPVFDPRVHQLVTQLGQILYLEIVPPGWDRAECLIGPMPVPNGPGLGYTVSREGVTVPEVNVNSAFHPLAHQLHDHWVEHWRQPFPSVVIVVRAKPQSGLSVQFEIVDQKSAETTTGLPDVDREPTGPQAPRPWWKFW